ncbi:hypothetical protein TNCV_974181 [Trichonephila clavipes]|nr:hypothetical protein TNCV_974181 [Trichonephila clavipes]
MTEKMPRRRIRAHYQQLSQFERRRIIELKEGGGVLELLVIWVEAMQTLEDAGKHGWKMADFSAMMVAVDLGPQQIERTDCLSYQLSQRLIHRYQPSDELHAHECPP